MSSSSLTHETKLQRSEKLIATELDGETVMIDIDSGNYFALTGSGSHIWAALGEPVTLNEIIEQVNQEFDTSDTENLNEVVAEFVAEMLKNGVAKIVSE